MSLYKTIDREVAKLEDPKVTSVKIQKDQARTLASFRSTIYTVASHRGIKIKVEQVAPLVYEVSRKLIDKGTGEFTGSLEVSKNVKLTTYKFNINSLSACILMMHEGIISCMEFISYSVHEVDSLRAEIEDMGLTDALSKLVLENTMNSLIIRVKNDLDRLAEPTP